jgi:hypothetical protein
VGKIATLALLAVAGSTFGQAGWLIEVLYEPGHASVNPLAPSCTVRFSAMFPPNDHAFAGARWDVLATEPGWSNNVLIPPINNSPGTSGGILAGAWVTGIIAGQVHFPPVIPANPLNPMPVWRATWSTADFRRREVTVTAATGRFDVYPSPTSPSSQSRLTILVADRARIVVTPAPAGIVTLGVMVAAGMRRRRPLRAGHRQEEVGDGPGA